MLPTYTIFKGPLSVRLAEKHDDAMLSRTMMIPKKFDLLPARG